MQDCCFLSMKGTAVIQKLALVIERRKLLPAFRALRVLLGSFEVETGVERGATLTDQSSQRSSVLGSDLVSVAVAVLHAAGRLAGRHLIVASREDQVILAGDDCPYLALHTGRAQACTVRLVHEKFQMFRRSFARRAHKTDVVKDLVAEAIFLPFGA